MKEATCRDCTTVFSYESRRGRPPVQCDSCKNPVIVLDTSEKDEVESDEESGPSDWGGSHGIGTTENHVTFKKGDKVKISGTNGTYNVYRDELNKDGSYTVYGGSKDPGGVRGFGAFLPSRLSYDKRKKF